MTPGDLVRRRQPATPPGDAILAGLGAAVTISVLGLLTEVTDTPWLAASFGASGVLMFFARDAAFSQPANVVGGHLVSGFVGVSLAAVLPSSWWTAGIGVGAAIVAMALLRVTHPPAGGNPIVILAMGQGWSTLLSPMLIGPLVLVLAAVVFHWLRGHDYPLRTSA